MKKSFPLTILAISLWMPAPLMGQNYDGPAQLPQAVPSSSYPDSCAYTGARETSPDACGFGIVHIADSGNKATNFTNLQNAINSPACGTAGLIIALAPGAEFSHGSVTLQYPGCSGKWIIIRSDVADTLLPPPGTRIDPSYAALLPKLVGQRPYGNTVMTYPNQAAGKGANHYWLGPGLEVTYEPGGPYTYALVQIGAHGETNPNQLPDHITVDRCYVHGPDATDDTHVGIGGDATNIVIVDNYVENIHQVGAESHGLFFFKTPGPGLVDHNYVECGAECFFVGGGNPPAGVVTSDFTVTHNHFFKPTQYWPGSQDYNGVESVTKNHVELKYGQRFLLEGNVFDNNWCCFSQYGSVFVLTPKNELGADPQAVVQDITFRYNLARHAMTALVMTTSRPSRGNGFPESGLRRLSAHDNIFSDIGGDWSEHGLGTYADGVQVGLIRLVGAQDPKAGAPDSITVDHNTIVGWGAYGTVLGSSLSDAPITHLTFTNNIAYWGSVGGSGRGFYTSGLLACPAMSATAPGGTWAGNAIVGTPAGDQPAYTSGCTLAPPRAPLLTASTSGGSIRDNTTVYVRITYTAGANRETLASPGAPAPLRWKPDSVYGELECIEDPNLNQQCGYNRGRSGTDEPAWHTTPVDAGTGDHGILWFLHANGVYGTITTGHSGSNANSISIRLPFADGGSETGWNVYASTSAGAERRQNSTPLSLSAVFTLTKLPSTLGRRVPASNTASIPAPNWAGWPATWQDVQFEDLKNGIYILLPSSPLKGKGTKGTDPGANYNLVMSKIVGVE